MLHYFLYTLLAIWIIFFILDILKILDKSFFESLSENLQDSFSENKIIDFTLKTTFLLVASIASLLVFALIFIVAPIIYFIKEQEDIDNVKESEKLKQQKLQHDKDFERYLEEEQEKERKEHPIFQFLMKHDDTIRPDTGEIIYIETEYNEAINDFFVRNYEKVKEMFATEFILEYNPDFKDTGLTFRYLPKSINETHINEMIRYNHPDIKEQVSYLEQDLAENIRLKFVDGLYGNHWMRSCEYFEGKKNSNGCYNHKSKELGAEGIEIKQGFIHYKRTEFNQEKNITEDEYTYYPLKYENDEQFFATILDYIKHTGTSEELFSTRLTPINLDEMDEEVQEITKDILEKMEKLRCKGLNNFILNQLLFPQLHLSKLKITADYRLFLTDYNNTEITMPTLSKALFFLYLRHSAGIPFKMLPNHQNELLSIYKKITKRDNTDAMLNSVERLCNPIENSINEKCSRIRNAFIQHFDENVSQFYYITTKETAVCANKVIALDRSLVIDEAGILSKM